MTGDSKMQILKESLDQSTSAEQLKIRSGLKSGASIESCQNNVNYWQQEFNKWYNQAIQKGYYPPFSNPVPTLY
jgi:hypothetical protein